MRLPVSINDKLDLVIGASSVRLSPSQALRLSEKLIVAGSRALVDQIVDEERSGRRTRNREGIR